MQNSAQGTAGSYWEPTGIVGVCGVPKPPQLNNYALRIGRRQGTPVILILESRCRSLIPTAFRASIEVKQALIDFTEILSDSTKNTQSIAEPFFRRLQGFYGSVDKIQ